MKTNEKIAREVVGGYKKIEEGVVGGYKKIEEGAVTALIRLQIICDNFLTKEGESIEDAKARLAAEQKAREEASTAERSSAFKNKMQLQRKICRKQNRHLKTREERQDLSRSYRQQ